MLQQTPVQTVLPYYETWMRLFPDIRALARAPLPKVLKAWQGLGYYERARNLWRAARQVVRNLGGELPRRYEDLRRLPGFGPYTTAAVLSLAFNQPYPVIDANVRRVLMRLTGLEGPADSRQDKWLLGWLEPFFPAERAADFNQALMELGALICRPRNARCLLCPLLAFCRAFASGTQEIIPPPKSRHFEKIEAVVAVIREAKKFLIQRRPDRGLLAGLWEFPGGKRRPEETLEDALRREVGEELKAEIDILASLLETVHAYTRFEVKLHAFACRFRSRPTLDPRRHRWVSLPSLRKYPCPSGSAKIITYLEKHKDKKLEVPWSGLEL